MPLYYFHHRTGHEAATASAKGREFPNLSAALAEAQHAARTMIRNRMRRAHCGAPEGSLDIEDEKRQPIARILLADVARQIS